MSASLNIKCLVFVSDENTWRKAELLYNVGHAYTVRVVQHHSVFNGQELTVTRNMLRNREPKSPAKKHQMTAKIQKLYDEQMAQREIRNILRVHTDTFMSKRSTELL